MERFDWKLPIRSLFLKMKIVGLWPQEDSYQLNLYSFWSFFCLIFFTFGLPFFQTINIFFNLNDLNALIATIYVTLTELLIVLKGTVTIKNMKILKQLLRDLDIQVFQPQNERQIDLIHTNLKSWRFVNVTFWIMVIGTIFFWAIYPLLDKTTENYQLPFLAWYPYNTTISPFYEFTYIHQVLGITFNGVTGFSLDTLIAILHVYIATQFEILCDNIRHMNADDNKIDGRFIDCIKHHQAILNFAAKSNKFSNWILLGQFLSSAISIGLTMFQLTTVVPLSSEFFSLLGFLISVTTEIFTYCWFGNEVEVKSNQLSYAAFESDWTGASKEIKKRMIFFVMKCQKPVRISALNLFYISLETFMAILRGSWSYFTLLNQVSSR